MTEQTKPATGLFAGRLRNAKVTERGAFLYPGTYAVKVNKGVWKHCRANNGKAAYDAFILEFVVMESSRPTTDPARGEHENPKEYEERLAKLPNKVGSTASWFQSCADEDVGFGSLKGFCAQITGANPEDPAFINGTEDQMGVEDLLSAIVNDGLVNGKIIPVEVVTIKTKRGSDFSLHKFSQIRE